ncbi:hypothetical protein [uncultured Alistipes sp.]|uniref:hypothetical protein n=1 Tax=uncultured Alistipes sp. TaxID=538949 RepID=UPI002628749C|nr:hypothetical protein [uncultured Alistipes sp.]
MIRRTLLAALLAAGLVTGAAAQDIRGHYVSKAEEDGTIYHTFPCTLFENSEAGDLTFDITYKEHRDGQATINFTYVMEHATPADSVRFEVGRVVMAAPVERIYLEPDRKRWKHRYTFRAPMASVGAFFDETAEPRITLYAGGRTWTYRVKRAAWRSYAPVGYRIFEMIRINEGL